MIITFLLWIIIFIISCFYGLMAVRLFQFFFRLKPEDVPTLAGLFFTGISFLIVFSLYFSLFMKIGLAADIILISAAALYIVIDFRFVRKTLLIYKKKLSGISPFLITAAIAFFLILLFETSAYRPKNYDTALYHAQSIHWAESYPAIPGLGNLHKRLAYDSSWFVLNPVFSLSFIKDQSFHVLNGLFLLIGSLFFLGGIQKLISGKKSMAAWLQVLILPLALFFFTNFASSPDSDTPAGIMIYYIFITFLEKTESDKTNSTDITIVLTVFLSSVLLTIKISSAPIFLLPLFIIIFELFKKRLLNVLFLCLMGLIAVFPWFARNIILSGYLIYPFSAINIFNFDWKIPLSVLEGDKKGMEEWSFPIGGRNLFTYLPQWLFQLRIQYKAVLFPLIVLAGMSVLSYLFMFLKNMKVFISGLKKQGHYVIFYATLYIAAAFLFITAPDVRYGSSFFVLFLLLHTVPALIVFLRRIEFRPAVRNIYSLFMVLMIISFEVFLFRRYFFSVRDNPFGIEKPSVVLTRLVLPAGYPIDAEPYRTLILTSGEYSFPVYLHTVDSCWYDPFPSTNEREFNYTKPELRGPSVIYGFKSE